MISLVAQIILLLLIAFVLGCVAGCWLRGRYGQEKDSTFAAGSRPETGQTGKPSGGQGTGGHQA